MQVKPLVLLLSSTRTRSILVKRRLLEPKLAPLAVPCHSADDVSEAHKLVHSGYHLQP